MKYWTICYPDDGRHVEETLSEPMILRDYFPYWAHKMAQANQHALISTERCIEDWTVVHWAWETDASGELIEPNIVRGYN